MHSDAKYLKKIPLNIKNKKIFNKIIDCVEEIEKTEYLTDKWYDLIDFLDNLVYETYNFNSEEKMFIENSMKDRLSNRWYKNGK